MGMLYSAVGNSIYNELVPCLFSFATAAAGRQKRLNTKLAFYGLVDFKFGEIRCKSVCVLSIVTGEEGECRSSKFHFLSSCLFALPLESPQLPLSVIIFFAWKKRERTKTRDN